MSGIDLYSYLTLLCQYFSAGESVEMTFQYKPGVAERNRKIICFAWCNKNMGRGPPERTTTVPTTTPSTSLINNLV